MLIRCIRSTLFIIFCLISFYWWIKFCFFWIFIFYFIAIFFLFLIIIVLVWFRNFFRLYIFGRIFLFNWWLLRFRLYFCRRIWAIIVSLWLVCILRFILWLCLKIFCLVIRWFDIRFSFVTDGDIARFDSSFAEVCSFFNSLLEDSLANDTFTLAIKNVAANTDTVPIEYFLILNLCLELPFFWILFFFKKSPLNYFLWNYIPC